MLDLQPPSFEAFEREARQGNVVPVVRSVLADLHTPVGAFMRIAGNAPYAFLLESVEGGERIARYSFLGTDPEMIVRGIGMQNLIPAQRPSGSETTFATASSHAAPVWSRSPAAQLVTLPTTRRNGLNRRCATTTHTRSMVQSMLSGCSIARYSRSIA
jgi:anthranilate/para-aminobenzoate synthase component I